MATYLDLVNKVLLESGKEQDQLTELTWDSQDASRRIYPKVKRLVQDAWKSIQMSRNEWEFKTAELFTTVRPRIKIANGYIDALDIPTQWRGAVSNTVIEFLNTEITEGSFEDGDAVGQIELLVVSGSSIQRGETFNGVDGTGSFDYIEKGSYDFLNDTNGLIREPHWTTFVAGRDTAYPNPVAYIPWDNFTYKSYSFVGTNQSVPNYVSQDFEGRLVFYPQPLAPFTISFVYDVAPQLLVEWDDVPFNIPEEYHEWIAWRALMSLARFDKDPDLFAYAESEHDEFQKRAERNLLPIPSYAPSRFNRRVYR